MSFGVNATVALTPHIWLLVLGGWALLLTGLMGGLLIAAAFEVNKERRRWRAAHWFYSDNEHKAAR